MRHFLISFLITLTISILAIGFTLILIPYATSVHAEPIRPAIDTVVQPPCGETEFDTAFAIVNSGGGTLTFNCGTALIIFSSQKVVEANVTIDGGGTITLSGGNATRLFTVAALKTLALDNLTLTRGNSGSAPGGAIMITDTGSVVADNVIFANNTSNDQDGSAVFGQGNAIITLTNSLVKNNNTNAYGALHSNGPVWISGSVFKNNTANLGGGALSLGGATQITNTQFISNSARVTWLVGRGGGIYLTTTASLTLTNAIISGNLAYYGGGIENYGTASLTHVIIINSNADYGGGIANYGMANLSDVMINGNGANSGSGLSNSGTALLTDVIVDSNVGAGDGGGIANGGTLTLTNVTISNNRIYYSSGGGIENYQSGTLYGNGVTISGNYAHNGGGGIDNSGVVSLTNVTLSGNQAAVGGGLVSGGTANLTNVTLSNNLANHGSGISVYGLAGYTGTITLRNTVIANNSGGNCERQDVPNAFLNSNGFNLSDDITCSAYFNQTGDMNNLNARLSGLANFGGPTLTHMPLRGSPAIDTGQCALSTDQRGQPRPAGIACDIGAVERQPGDWEGYLYLPLVRK